MARLLAAVILFSSLALAQSSTPQTPPPGAQQNTGAGAAQAQPGPGMRPRMGSMRAHMEQQMQAQIEQMQKLLDQLKSDSAAIQDPAGKKVADDNVALWQAVVDHMKQMGTMMRPPRPMPPHPSAMPPKQ